MGDRLAKGLVAELFRGHQQQPDVAELDLLEHIGPFRHRQQAVQRGGALNVARQQAVDLVLHQRLQRRNDHRQAAIAVVAIECRELVAD